MDLMGPKYEKNHPGVWQNNCTDNEEWVVQKIPN